MQPYNLALLALLAVLVVFNAVVEIRSWNKPESGNQSLYVGGGGGQLQQRVLGGMLAGQRQQDGVQGGMSLGHPGAPGPGTVLPSQQWNAIRGANTGGPVRWTDWNSPAVQQAQALPRASSAVSASVLAAAAPPSGPAPVAFPMAAQLPSQGQQGLEQGQQQEEEQIPQLSPPTREATPAAPVAAVVSTPESGRSSSPPCVPVPVRPASQIPSSSLVSSAEFKAVLQRVASPSCDVIVSAGNAGFVSMLTNLMQTSIKALGLTNFLAVALSDGVCDRLPAGTACFRYPENFESGNYGSSKFAHLVNVKTEITMAIVALGYNALLVDGDIVFLQDPFSVLSKSPVDLQIQDDAEGGRNSGFMYIRRTPLGLSFLGRALEISNRKPGIRQQPAVNDALKEYARKPNFHHQVLTKEQFPCGKAYFENPRRMFAFDNPCTTCVIMHNNWIVGAAAKVFRFKEHVKWMVDTDGYYSSPSTKYLEYGNPDPGVSLAFEKRALRNAFKLGQALGRVVILPAFHCHGCKVTGAGGTQQGCSGSSGSRDTCSFLAHFSVASLNKSFSNKYREHMFRYNPLVPPSIRLDYTIEPANKQGDGGGNVPVFSLSPTDAPYRPFGTNILAGEVGSTVSVSRVKELVEPHASAQVIRFVSLHSLDVVLGDDADLPFNSKFDKAIKPSSVRQY